MKYYSLTFSIKDYNIVLSCFRLQPIQSCSLKFRLFIQINEEVRKGWYNLSIHQLNLRDCSFKNLQFKSFIIQNYFFLSKLQQQKQNSDINHSPFQPNENREFIFFDKEDNGRKSQYLSMKVFKVHKDVKDKNGKLIKNLIKRRPVNKVLNYGINFEHQDDILSLIFKRMHQNISQQIRMRQIAILNKFYQKTSEQLPENLPDGSVRSRQNSFYCRIPKIQFKVNEAPIKVFATKNMENRFQQLQLIAKSFVNRGYGLIAFHSELEESRGEVTVNLTSYRNLIGTVLTQAFRKLQGFTLQQCCMDIRRANRTQLKLLFISLLNCRSHFSPHDCQTLLKYVKMCYYIEDVSISAQSSVRLMNTIQEILKKRIHQKTGEYPSEQAHHSGNETMWTARGGFTNEKYQLHRIWNGQLQRLLAKQYKKNSDMNRIARAFRKEYPKKLNFFTPEAIKVRLNRTLRESIKKMEFLREIQSDFKMPRMGSMNKASLRAILQSPKLYRLRLTLLDFNISQNCSSEQLQKAIEAFNEVVTTRKSVRSVEYSKRQGLQRQWQDIETELNDMDIEQLISFED